jgi:hypothetical protein
VRGYFLPVWGMSGIDKFPEAGVECQHISKTP